VTTCVWYPEGDPLTGEPDGPTCGAPATHVSCVPWLGGAHVCGAQVRARCLDVVRSFRPLCLNEGERAMIIDDQRPSLRRWWRRMEDRHTTALQLTVSIGAWLVVCLLYYLVSHIPWERLP
jgi:hypothetical protein